MDIADYINETGISTSPLALQDIEGVINTLLLDNQLERAHLPLGTCTG